MSLISTDLELVSDFEPATSGVQKVGMRFTGVTVTRRCNGYRCVSDLSSIAADDPNTNSDATNLIIKGQLLIMRHLLTTSSNISSGSLTTASAPWEHTSGL